MEIVMVGLLEKSHHIASESACLFLFHRLGSNTIVMVGRVQTRPFSMGDVELGGFETFAPHDRKHSHYSCLTVPHEVMAHGTIRG
jgi:hypothetical protein